jgi:hypothetical protein
MSERGARSAWAQERAISITLTLAIDNRFASVGSQDYTVFAAVSRRLLARKASEAAATGASAD